MGSGIKIVNQGSLTELGYSASSSAPERQKALQKAIKLYGLSDVIRKINALVVLNKGRPELHKKFSSDMRFLQAKRSG